MTKAVLGIIGGSGIYDLPGLENAREEAISSPWGEPSAPVRRGTIAGLPIVFMPRHDKGHRLSPSDINYRANIDVLKRAAAAEAEAITIARGGTYVCIEAPQFSTYAQSMTYKDLGYSVNGMTNMPEA